MFIHIFYKNEFVRSLDLGEDLRPVSIGRGEDCGIPLAFDSLISRKHAQLTFEGGHAWVEDLGSKNGVFIDGKKVARALVPFETRVHMGDSAVLVSQAPLQEVKKTVVLDKKVLESMKKSMAPQRTGEALDFLYRISGRLSSYQDETSMLDDLFEEMMAAFGADRIIYFDVVRKGKDVAVRKLADRKFAEERAAFSRSVVGDVLANREAVFIQNVAQEAPDGRASVRAIGINSLIAVPLLSGRDVTGILQMEALQSQKSFGDEDFHMICVLSQMLSGFLRNMKALDAARKDSAALRGELDQEREIIGEDRKTQDIRKLIRQVAKTNTTVLVTGESGTGKELIARAIHGESARKDRPFLVINCAAIPGNLIESELFGHVKGAFTGADRTRTGKLEAADGGSVFLDEIGDMSMDLQTRLLRFLESGEIQPVGSNEARIADVRVIAATNRDLRQEVKENAFRKDLYYRLSVFHIESPPLRERGKDILRIARHYLQKFSSSMGKGMTDISPEAEKALAAYPWPGNIRELRNVIERACVIGEGPELLGEFLPEDMRTGNADAGPGAVAVDGAVTLADVEKGHILRVLREQKDNKAKTAGILGITRKTLYSKLKEYGIHQ